MKTGNSESKEFLQAVKEGMEVQSKNFASVLKSMQKGFVDFKGSGSSLEKIFKDISLLNDANAKNVIKILTKHKAVKSGSDITALEKLLLSEVNAKSDISVQLKNNPEYANIVKLITATQRQATFLETNMDNISESISTNSDSIDATLDSLSAFHRQLEMLSAEYKRQGIYQDLIGININASKESISDLLVEASKYTDMLSVMDVPSISADEALSEFGKLKKDINSDDIDIMGKVALNFNDAATLVSDRFNTELDGIRDRVIDIQDNILEGILAVRGLTPNDGGGLTFKGITPVDAESANLQIAEAQALQEIFNVMASHNAMMLKYGTDQSKLDIDRLHFADELIANHIELGKLQTDGINGDVERLKYLDDYISQIESEIESLEEKEQLLFHIHTSALSMLSIQNKSIELAKTELSLIEKYRSTIQSVEGVQENILDKLKFSLASLPQWVQGLLGTDKAFDAIEKSAMTAFNTMTEKLFNPDNPANFFDAITGYAKDFTTSLLGTISPIKLMAIGFALAAVSVYNIMGNVRDVSEQLGISKSEAYKLYDSMLLMEGASGNIAVTQERIMQMQTAHLERYGKLIDMSTKEGKELVEYGSLMSSAYGIAADEATSMISLFKQIGAEDGLANNLAASTLKAAELAKISPKIIAKDLIDGAEEVSMYFGNMPEQAALAAINIRRMGSNIKKVGEQMQSTWNIESFMSNMYEVAQLTGSEINLSGVFDAGITGDAEAFQESLLDALGSLDQINDYSPQAQKKIAETIGMSVGEMKNMLRLSEMNLSLTEEEQSALNGQLASMGDITGMSKADLEAKAKSFAATEAMNMAWTRITATLTRALLPVVEVFSDVLVALGPVLDILGLGFKLIGLAIKPFIPALKFVSSIIGAISTKITDLLRLFDSGISKVEGIGSGMGEWVKTGGSLLLLSGLLISKWGTIGSIVSGIFTAPLKMLKSMIGMTGKLTGLGNLFGKGGTDIASTITSTVTNAASESTSSTIMDKIKEQKDKLLERFTSTSEGSAETTPSKTLQEKIKSGMATLKEFTTGLADAIIEPIKKIAGGVGDAFKSILGGIADGLNKFSPKAAIGAASLLIVSGALWVTSKALENFNNVEWGSVAKGILAITGLAGVAMLLGSASPQMILGSIAIALLGASLIPMAYALNMLNDVNWDSLAKGGAALVGFGLIAAAMGAALPFITLGSIAIAGLGASLVVFGAGLSVVSNSVSSMSAVVDGMISSISKLREINPATLGDIAVGLSTIGLAFGSIGNSGGMFSGDPISKISQLAATAPAIALLAASFMSLVESIKQFSDVSMSIPETTIESVQKASANVAASENISKETNYNTTTNNAPPMNGNSKMEMLLSQLVALMQEQVSNPVPAVIGNDQIPSLAKKVKSFNNR
jgi:hypothetical protein